MEGKLKDIAPETLQISQGYGSTIGGLYLVYAAFAPVGAMLVYRKFSHSLQDLLMKHFLCALAVPVGLAILTTVVASIAFPAVRNPEIPSANLFRLTPWAIAFGIGGGLYGYLEYEREFAEWFQEPALRKMVPVCLTAVFLILWALALS